MKNCLILGCGRSGTSMLAGILHQAGYFMGDKLYLPRDSNPKGFFEWSAINKINEAILAPYGKKSLYSLCLKKLFKKSVVEDPGRNQRWLMSLPLHVSVSNSSFPIEEEIRNVIEREPFAYKDPRFSYTLPVWRRFLKPDTVFLCIFREPDVTVESILKECRSQNYLADLVISRRSAYRVWSNIYAHTLFLNAGMQGSCFFVHYDQVFKRTALPALSEFLQAGLTAAFIDPDLKRTASRGRLPGRARTIYRQLCAQAGYHSP